MFGADEQGEIFSKLGGVCDYDDDDDNGMRCRDFGTPSLEPFQKPRNEQDPEKKKKGY